MPTELPVNAQFYQVELTLNTNIQRRGHSEVAFIITTTFFFWSRMAAGSLRPKQFSINENTADSLRPTDFTIHEDSICPELSLEQRQRRKTSYFCELIIDLEMEDVISIDEEIIRNQSFMCEFSLTFSRDEADMCEYSWTFSWDKAGMFMFAIWWAHTHKSHTTLPPCPNCQYLNICNSMALIV